jgi:hypothetical protein
MARGQVSQRQADRGALGVRRHPHRALHGAGDLADLRAAPVDAPPYTTPYLALMQEAIERFGLCEERQEKKESLFEWFVSKHVDGKPVSNNLADAMSTLIRLPRSQHGGSKRVEGPDLRQAG